VRGAEVICRPSALLRSADIWELTNRAAAYDNHVYVVGANATGAIRRSALLRQLDDRDARSPRSSPAPPRTSAGSAPASTPSGRWPA
jgi:predicted amidohydrolase